MSNIDLKLGMRHLDFRTYVHSYPEFYYVCKVLNDNTDAADNVKYNKIFMFSFSLD